MPGSYLKDTSAVPFEHSAGISFLTDASHHPAVLQRHALQKPVIHIVSNSDGEDAELFPHSGASASQDEGGLSLSDRRAPISEEDDEGDAVWAGGCRV